MRGKDLTGKTFGRWTVIKKASRTYQTMWECRCSCGTVRNVSYANLANSKSKSCGCLRDELRPTYARKRDFSGLNNPRARNSAKENGGVWLPSSSVWYKRAASIFHGAKNNGIPLGFNSAAELALYIRDIAPAKCPVFNVEFVERGNGYSRFSPSVDKINPKLGYVRGNMQVISLLANCMKRDSTEEELRLFAEWVVKGLKCKS